MCIECQTSSESERDAETPPDILTALASLGPFFAVDMHESGERPQPPWLAVSALTGRPDMMRDRIAAVRQALAISTGRPAEQIETKVAASAAHFGLVARLVSPALAALASGYQLNTQPSELWWQDVLGGPFPVSVPVPVHCLDSAETACRELISGLIEPVTSMVAEVIPMSPRVLWGNVASAVNSASRQIATKRPTAADARHHLAEVVFSAPQLLSERSAPGPGFRRSSCCLIYRLPSGLGRETCGDCVLS